jgi:hypothetical protein
MHPAPISRFRPCRTHGQLLRSVPTKQPSGGSSRTGTRSRPSLFAAAFDSRTAPPLTSNLGVLSSVVTERSGAAATPSPADAPYGSYRVTPESLGARGMYMDPAPITVGVLLLLLLVYLSVERITGLDKVVTAALLRWRDARAEARREETYDARESLERLWGGDGEEEGKQGDESGGGGSGAGGGKRGTRGP